MRRLRVLVAAVLLLGLGTPGLRPARAEWPSCAWAFRLEPTVTNTLYPDEFASYWVTAIPAVPGMTLTIRGKFPYARYLSFTSYNVGLQSADGLNDTRIAPDRGSVNPFLPGARRYDDQRTYTVQVVFGQRPASPAPNTLYTTNEAGNKTGPMFIVALRVYRPDRGLDNTGGVGLPSVTVVPPGAPARQLPTCPYPGPITSSANARVAEAGVPLPGAAPAPGTDPPTWHRYYSALVSLTQLADNGLSGTAIGDGLQPATTAVVPQGGLLDNPDNAYVFTTMNPSYGETLVVRARLPRTPRTYPHADRMPASQLRYWSLCTYETAGQRYYRCVMDDGVATDRQGHYTVVVSSGARRPRNATPGCGISWLPAGPAPETLLIVRNMLPSAGFRQAIQHAPFGGEAAALGEYYPAARYASVAEVEALGCRKA